MSRARDLADSASVVDPLDGLYGSSSSPIIITVKVATKTASHPYNGDGSSSGYTLNNVESPAIKFGGTDAATSSTEYVYRFDQADSSNSGHPLRFYLDAAKATAFTTGVTTNGTAGSAGAYTQIAVDSETPKILYYQCSSHAYMGNYATVSGSLSFSAGSLRIADTAVTSTGAEINKLDALSRGSLIYGNASAATAILTKGSANQVLTSDGTDIAWANAAAGGTNGWEYISTTTANNVSTADIEGLDNTYPFYKIIGYDVYLYTSYYELKVRFKISGSYATSGYKTTTTMINTVNANRSTENSNSLSYMLLHRAYISNDPHEPMTFEMTIPNPSNSATEQLFFADAASNNNASTQTSHNSNTEMYRSYAMGGITTPGAVTGVRIFPHTNTIYGTFKLYGLKGS